ncbi:tagatose 6-phosphate kinase [Streptacidiphilus sp. MAP12-33]|uniref:1-phosphofructokinase family hexose kinase n=1 Tax=Streptacidiphilus sp. MAP12-33 TaxID=3156266 RepID=UPI003516F901
MIVTVTLNAALDITYVVEGGVRPGATHRVRSVAERAGGKGVNTARVLASLGEPVLALGLTGGASGAALLAELDTAGIPHRFTPVAGSTRRTVAVVAQPLPGATPDTGHPGDAAGGTSGFGQPGPQAPDPDRHNPAGHNAPTHDGTADETSGLGQPGPQTPDPDRHNPAGHNAPTHGGADTEVTGFWEPGPEVSDGEWELFLAEFRAVVRDGVRAVVLAGSLPPGVPRDAYAQLVRLAADAGAPTLVDADADALREALAARPALVKPNAEEAARALGDEAPCGPDVPGALARRLVAAGAGAAVVSAGAAGLVAWWDGRMLAAAPPRVVVGNPTGAGDAASAALALALMRGSAPEDALAHAVALSAAAVAAPLAGDVDAQVLAELEPLVTARPLS